MIQLKSLTLEGFRRFTAPVTISFPRSGLLLLRGDSGVGKSTIFDAIAYALNICSFSGSALKSWSGESLQVVLTLEDSGQEVKIGRGKKTYVERGGVVHTGAAAHAEQVSILFGGLKPELLSAITYREQDTLGTFLAKDDAEKKEFLGGILGLDKIENAIEVSGKEISVLKTKLAFAEGVLAEKTGALAKLEATEVEVSPDTPLDPTVIARVTSARDVVASLTQQVAASKKALEAAWTQFQADCSVQRSGLEAKLVAARNLYDKAKAVNVSGRRAVDERRGALIASSTKLGQDLKNIGEARKKLAETESQLAALRKSTCYVCGQHYVGELVIDELVDSQKYYESVIASEPRVQREIATLKQQVAEMVFVPDPAEAELARVVTESETRLQHLGKTITDHRVIDAEKAKQNYEAQLSVAKRELYDAEQVVSRHEAEAQAKDRQRKRREALVLQAQSELLAQSELTDKIRKDLALELDFVDFLGKSGFLGIIFAEVLTEISHSANQKLALLPNVAHVTVQFSLENPKGKKTITPRLFVNGHETTRKGGVSGGMGAAIDLAVDLGVIDVVERRKGTGPGWICIDEAFNGMPSATKEQALEILSEFAKDRLVLVVDHSSEVQEKFSQVMTVVSTPEGNRVV